MFGLVVRNEVSMPESSVFGSIHKDLVSRSLVCEWPGTKLINEDAVCVRFRFSEPSVRFLKSVDGLYSWQAPLPEDLHFVRWDGTILLASIAHEQDAFVNLDESELLDFRRLLPEIEISADEHGPPSTKSD